MKTKKIILTICALVASVVVTVGAVFASNWWYSFNYSNRMKNQLTFGKPIQAYIKGDVTTVGGDWDDEIDDEINPGEHATTPVYTIIVADINDPDIYDDFHGNTSSNVTQKYAYNLYFKINENRNTANTQYWTMLCSSAWVTEPGATGYVENKTKPYGENVYTAPRALPLKKDQPNADNSYYDRVLLMSNVGFGDTFSLTFFFSNDEENYPDPAESKRTLAFDLVLEIEEIVSDPAEVEYLDVT